MKQLSKQPSKRRPGKPTISDAEYDRIKKVLFELESRFDKTTIGKKLGVSQSAVTQWTKNNRPSHGSARGIFELAGRHPDEWRDGAQSLEPTQLEKLARRLALSSELVTEIVAGAAGAEMDELSVELRRAVLGVVHVLGYPLETAIRAARALAKKHPGDDSPAVWFERLRGELPQRPPSGTHPVAEVALLKIKP